jgi:hypothetical protein
MSPLVMAAAAPCSSAVQHGSSAIQWGALGAIYSTDIGWWVDSTTPQYPRRIPSLTVEAGIGRTQPRHEVELSQRTQRALQVTPQRARLRRPTPPRILSPVARCIEAQWAPCGASIRVRVQRTGSHN